jgi:arginyl-tRNA synthetase
LHRVATDLGAPNAEVILEPPKDAKHGDLATALALQLAKRLGQKPRELAESIISRLDLGTCAVAKAEVAGPGFINFWLAEEALTAVLRSVLAESGQYGSASIGRGLKANVEFVSANPTGPLHVGHGRGAALGDAIASLLDAVGYEVTREFYVNDAGVQIDRLAESLWARVQQAVGRDTDVPEGGYHGGYLEDLAGQILRKEGNLFADLPEEDGLARCRAFAVASQRSEQDSDLADFGVEFDIISSESDLYGKGMVADTLDDLLQRGLTYEKDGAVWLRTAAHGDEKDRVLRKKDGSYTYFLPDIAYHRDKAARGFNRAIDVWGADHHGYVDRMTAAMRAIGLSENFFEAVLVQLVRVMRHGEEVRFSKRSGDFVTLRDLFEEAGVDAARYFFLMRRADAQFVFDLDLATKQSEENPVYYVQYAHTRMAGIFRKAGVEARTVLADDADLSLLAEDDEQAIIKFLAEFPKTVVRAAEVLEPHRIAVYVEELARLVNGWYHRHRVVGSGEGLERARLVLVRAAQIVLANGLRLLGVTAPERM